MLNEDHKSYIDTYVEKWVSKAEIWRMLKEEFWFDCTDETARKRVSNYLNTRSYDLNDIVEDRTEKSKVWFDEKWYAIFTIKDIDLWTWDEILHEISNLHISVIDDIFLDYSHTIWNRLDSNTIIHKYKLYEYYKNPTKIFSFLRTYLWLNTKCTVWSYYTDSKNKLLWKKEYNKLVEERVSRAVEDRYEVDHIKQNTELELKYLRKKLKEQNKIISENQTLCNHFSNLSITPIEIKKVKIKNNKEVWVKFGDIHYWA